MKQQNVFMNLVY